MERTIPALVLALTFGQASSQPYTGTWIAELSGKTYVRLELRTTQGALAGGIGLGNIEVDAQGDVRTAGDAPRELTPPPGRSGGISISTTLRRDPMMV